MLDAFDDGGANFAIRLIIVKGIEVKGEFTVAGCAVLPIDVAQTLAIAALFKRFNNFRRCRLVVSGQCPSG